MSEITEDPGERALRYIQSFEAAIKNFAPANSDAVAKAVAVKRVRDAMTRYLNDARYYLTNGKPVTALASIAYAEGLMDALIFLELTNNKNSYS